MVHVPRDLNVIVVITIAVLVGMYLGATQFSRDYPQIGTLKNFLPPGSEDYVAKVREGPMYETVVIDINCSNSTLSSLGQVCEYVITNYFKHPIVIYSVTEPDGEVLASNITLGPGESITVRPTKNVPIIVRTSEGVWYGLIAHL